MDCSQFLRHARACPGHDVFFCRGDHKDVDARDKPGHDETTYLTNKKAPAKPGPLDISELKTDQRE